jgi:hypothetical protein
MMKIQPDRASIVSSQNNKLQQLLLRRGIADHSAQALAHHFFSRHPRKLSRFMATFPFYADLFKPGRVVINEAVLHKLTNPDQLPRANALCAYNFVNPQHLAADYAKGADEEFEDVSMLEEYPRLLQNFVKRVPVGSRVLSLGFGSAKLEKHLIDKKSCQVIGIEFLPEAAKAGKKLGIKVVQGDIHGSISMLRAGFDVVIMSEVLGDLDSHAIFKQINPLLPRSGKILLSTYLPIGEADGTGYERMWTSSLLAILAKHGLTVTDKKVWQITGESAEDEEIQMLKGAHDLAESYVFYEICRGGMR